jgi:hypothetical protein
MGVHQLFVDFQNAYDSVRREVLYCILIEIEVSMIIGRMSKMCLNKTYTKKVLIATAYQLCSRICH